MNAHPSKTFLEYIIIGILLGVNRRMQRNRLRVGNGLKLFPMATTATKMWNIIDKKVVFNFFFRVPPPPLNFSAVFSENVNVTLVSNARSDFPAFPIVYGGLIFSCNDSVLSISTYYTSFVTNFSLQNGICSLTGNSNPTYMIQSSCTGNIISFSSA